MKKVEITTRIENNQVVRNRSLLVNAINSFNNVDVVITIQKKKKQRSNRQNAYYFGIIIPIIREGLKDITGEMFDANETHNFLKHQFCYTELVNENTGEIVKLPKSTTDNSTIEMEEYHERIRTFALDFLNAKIPLPNEELKLEL